LIFLMENLSYRPNYLTFLFFTQRMVFIDKCDQALIDMKRASFKRGRRYAKLLAFTARVIS
jgi:hypothetical protein